jgi:phospholipid-binding lipoprotein MlaA
LAQSGICVGPRILLTEDADVIDLRSRNLDVLDDLEKQSVDFYSTMRSLYRQNRDYEIRNGESETGNLPDY